MVRDYKMSRESETLHRNPHRALPQVRRQVKIQKNRVFVALAVGTICTLLLVLLFSGESSGYRPLKMIVVIFGAFAFFSCIMDYRIMEVKRKRYEDLQSEIQKIDSAAK